MPLTKSTSKQARAMQTKIENGDLSAEAPCDAMYNEWSDEQRGRLKGVLAQVFGWSLSQDKTPNHELRTNPSM